MVDFPWTQSYPAGVRWDAELPLMPVQKILDDAVARWPERPALDFMGRVISYGELGALTDRAAAGLQRLGVGPGVHVGLYLPNSPHYPIAFFGVLKAGGTVVNYSPLDAERVLEHKVEDSETDILVTLDLAALYPQVGRLLGRSRLKKMVVGSLGEYTASPPAVRAQLEGARQLCGVPTDDLHLSFDQLLANDGRYRAHAIDDLARATVVLQYTGGTTGLPKGAMLTHANLSAACAQYVETTRGEPPILAEGEERVLVVLPLFHIYSLTVNLLLGFRLGALLVLHARFDLDTVMSDLSAKKITVFAGVPTMFTAMVNHPKVSALDLKSLKFCGSGGAPLPAWPGLPALGLTRERQEAVERLGKAAMRYQQALGRYGELLGKVSSDAVERLTRRITRISRPDEQIGSFRAMYDLWVECGEEAFAAAAHGTEFAKAQSDVNEALMELKSEQQQQVEDWARALDLPTRTEMNTLLRRVNTLRRRLREVEEELESGRRKKSK